MEELGCSQGAYVSDGFEAESWQPGVRCWNRERRRPAGPVGIASIGVVLTVYYYRSRRLWPVVVAHGLLDLLALVRVNAGIG